MSKETDQSKSEEADSVPSYDEAVGQDITAAPQEQLGRLTVVSAMEPEQAQEHDEIVRSLRKHAFKDPRTLLYEINFTWEIPNFHHTINSTQGGSFVRSPPFTYKGYSWVMRLYPRRETPDGDYFGLYLEAGPVNKRRIGWKVGAKYGLVAWNPMLPHIYQELKSADRMFVFKEPAWGVSKFCKIAKLDHRREGHEEGLLHDGVLNITAYIKVFD